MCIHQAGHGCGKRIVIADLDLLNSDRIVFIDNGNDALFQKRLDGMLGVEVAFAISQVIVAQKYLGNLQSFFFESLLIGMHQETLADSRTGLLFRNR